MSIEAILESIEKITLLEAAELVKAMEEKFGVSAAAPVAVAAAPAAADEVHQVQRALQEPDLCKAGDNRLFCRRARQEEEEAPRAVPYSLDHRLHCPLRADPGRP